MTTFTKLTLVALAGACLAGCRSAYDVGVRNYTDQPITARLNTPFSDGAPRTLREARIGPGDRANLFVQTDASARVALWVDFAGNEGYPATIDLSRGETIVNVRRVEENQSRGRIRLEEIPRP